MKIEVIPNIGFVIDDKDFNWESDRATLRKNLENQHRENDNKRNNIIRRRDIYKDINDNKNFFFLNYDEEEKLESLEVHSGVTITINKIELIFEKDINEYLKLFKSHGEYYTEIEDGNYLFQNLKITIANSESMGGNGNGLSYFYTSKSIEHLIEK
nr:hypothetical protein [uncultured Flavobacterium sp.]